MGYFEYLAQPGEFVNYKKWIFLIVCLAIGLIGAFLLVIFGASFFPFSFFLAGGVMVAMLFVYRSLAARTEVEFEYCVADGTLGIDRVFARRFRRHYFELETKSVVRISPYAQSEAEALPVVYAAPQARDDLYTLFYRDEEGTECALILALDSNALTQLRAACPRARR